MKIFSYTIFTKKQLQELVELHIREICQEIQDPCMNKEDDRQEQLENVKGDKGMYNLENMLEY